MEGGDGRGVAPSSGLRVEMKPILSRIRRWLGHWIPGAAVAYFLPPLLVGLFRLMLVWREAFASGDWHLIFLYLSLAFLGGKWMHERLSLDEKAKSGA